VVLCVVWQKFVVVSDVLDISAIREISVYEVCFALCAIDFATDDRMISLGQVRWQSAICVHVALILY
jgi:hypothetical protein